MHDDSIKKREILSIVVPCFNEEDTLKQSHPRLLSVINYLLKNEKISDKSFILYVDDGSRDSTWEIIKELICSSKNVKGLKLASNSGHQNAVIAGLMKSKDLSDMVISIDADLQQDETVIKDFVNKYYEGYDIVFGVREDRNTDSLLKKLSAVIFYKLMKIMGSQVVFNHADYRLVSKRVIQELANYTEVNLFLRGLFTFIGFKTTTITHKVSRRLHGSSKYSIAKMFSLALNGITSFSIIPIRIISLIGFLLFIFSIIMICYALLQKFRGYAASGWTSTVLPIYLIGGIQLLSLGLIGEYIGKIYMETKRRPRYIIEEDL